MYKFHSKSLRKESHKGQGLWNATQDTSCANYYHFEILSQMSMKSNKKIHE